MSRARPELKIRDFLLSRGWRKYPIGNWWYKPEPEWGDFIPMGVEIHGIGSAFEIERRILIRYCETCGQAIGEGITE